MISKSMELNGVMHRKAEKGNILTSLFEYQIAMELQSRVYSEYGYISFIKQLRQYLRCYETSIIYSYVE